MNRYIAAAVLSLVPWGIWLVLTMLGKGVSFDGLAFVFAAVTTSQLYVLAARDPNCDAFKVQLALQAALNLTAVVALMAGLNGESVRAVQMLGTVGQLAVAYVIAFRRRRTAH